MKGFLRDGKNTPALIALQGEVLWIRDRNNRNLGVATIKQTIIDVDDQEINTKVKTYLLNPHSGNEELLIDELNEPCVLSAELEDDGFYYFRIMTFSDLAHYYAKDREIIAAGKILKRKREETARKYREWKER